MISPYKDIKIVGMFTAARHAVEYAAKHPVDVAFLDIQLPETNGIVLSRMLRGINPNMITVFISAHERYLHDANEVGGDYYLVKPYTVKGVENMVNQIMHLSSRLKKDIYVQTFGRFLVTYKGKPLPLTGKAKEILAYVVAAHGKEISNDEIYQAIWEGRPGDNTSKTVYFNAMGRLKRTLEKAGIEDMLISTKRGQMVDVNIFDCDYYMWLDKSPLRAGSQFEGQFLPEYTWAESILGNLMGSYYEE